jgi:tetratricopeptide (TPR) repeat protein
MVKVYDGYGREMFITKQQWRDNVLLGNLQEKRNDPDQLYGMLVGALQDGFASDIVTFAEHLHRTDPIPSRGATILGIVYMENNRLDEAEKTLKDFLSKHGDDGVVLTNLAKIYSRQGNNTRAESTLWRGLEVDPNQDNGLGWYAAIHRDRGGEVEVLNAYHRVATLPRSWRAQLWLARDALQRKDFTNAVTLYSEALGRVETPAPADMLMQMSGDLGNNGCLKEIVRLVEPRFDPAVHGLQVGNNLIKANHELGQIDSARHILSQLFAQKRPDWQETLRYWDTELAKTEIAERSKKNQGPLSVALMTVEGPLWSRDGSPFAALLPSRADNARSIAILGSTALLADPPKEPTAQMTDSSGRISRAIPLLLAERIHLHTDATGIALIPWVQNQGFAVFGRPYDDKGMCGLAAKGNKPPDFLVGLTVDATQPNWNLLIRLIRTADGVRTAERQFEADPQNPARAVECLAEATENLLVKHAGVRAVRPPAWYRVPIGLDFSDYLLRLEQQLAVTCMHLDFLAGGGLSGEHEIVDGIIHLCVRQPNSELIRMVLAQTLRQMKKVRPSVFSEYRERLALLQREHPLEGDVGSMIMDSISAAMADEASHIP